MAKMQLSLSNLVDIALGKPHYLECLNFNILHVVLQVALKKMNLADTRVELMDELADKTSKLMARKVDSPYRLRSVSKFRLLSSIRIV